MDVDLIDYMGSDLSVVNAARVSFGKYHRIFDEVKDSRLINYLARHKHMSPFGHAFATFHVSAPIFVARQLVKHKFLRWNEISRRYVDDEPEFYQTDTWRGRSADKKQGSEGEVVSFSDEAVTEYNNSCLSFYKGLLSDGVAPEQARMVLPQNTMTEWYWSGSLDALADMCNLRCTSDTQLETKIIADNIDNTMRGLYPVSWKSLRGE
jgi:thymidylate synthase (FAD)